MCKVSVIVPVYNTEKYLRACLNSLAAQTLEDFEVIIVNDGSTDNSLSIAEEFAACHSNFKLFSIENNGVSHARNYGAAMSRGDYLAFVDSDDEVEPDYCKAMYEKAIRDGNDVVMCRIDHIVYRNGVIKAITYSKSFWEDDNFRLTEHPQLLAHISTHSGNKLVERSLFFRVKFPEEIKYIEDFSYVVRLFCLAKNIGVVKQILYHYYHIHNGVTSHFGPERLDRVPCMVQIDQFMKQYGLFKAFQLELEYLYLLTFSSCSTVFRNDAFSWNIRLRYVQQTQAFLREYCPHWRRNPYYRAQMRERAREFRPSYYNYGLGHSLLLLYLSRFLPQILYKQVLRADHVLVFTGRYIRWVLFGSI